MRIRKKKDLLYIINFVVWTLVIITGIVLFSHSELPFVIELVFYIAAAWTFGSTLDDLFWKKKRLGDLKFMIRRNIYIKERDIHNQISFDKVINNIDKVRGIFNMVRDDTGTTRIYVRFDDDDDFLIIDLTPEQDEQVQLLWDDKLERDKHITIEKAIEIVENDGWIVDMEEEIK